MQLHPVGSKNMISAADHGWEEQDKYDLEENEDTLEWLMKQELHLPPPALSLWLVPPDLLQLQLKMKMLEDFLGNIVITKDLEGHLCGRWGHFLKYALQPLGMLHFKAFPGDGTRLEEFHRNIVINKDPKWRLYGLLDHFQKYPVNPLGILGFQPLPGDHAYLRFHNKTGGTSPVVIDIYTYFSCSRIHRPKHLRKGPFICSVPFCTWTNKTTSATIPATPGPGYTGFVPHSTKNKPNHVRKNIFMLRRAREGGSSSEETGFTLTGGDSHHRETDSAYNDMPEVILDNQAQVNCTGNFNVLSNLSIGPKNIVLIAANGEEMPTLMSGSVRSASFELNDVHYCPDLGNRIIVSGSMLDNDDYGYEFGYRRFTVKDLKTDTIVGEGRLVDGNYIVEYLRIPRERTPRLVTTVWNAVCSALHRLGLKY